MLNNFSTPSWDSLNLHTLKKTGAGEYHGPCPVSKQGIDCFWIQPERKLLGCRSCSLDGGRLEGQQFKDHLEALGATFGEHDVLLSYEWLDHASDETVIQTRHEGAKKYLWPKDTKTGTLVYPARYDREATRQIVWTEGAKAATAAAAKLPADDYDVIGFVSSSTIPNSKTLTALSRGRSCIVWPDDDLPGAKVAARLVSALARSALDVRTVVPARLGLTGGRGDDAAEWRPDGEPVEAFRAACGTAQPAAVAHFRSIWTYAAEAAPDVLIPGLAWRGRVSKISAAPKLGKTSLIANGIAAWQAGGMFLGEQTGPAGSILYVSETPVGLLRSWLERYGCPSGAPILAGGSAGVDAIAETAREHRPDLVIIDSLTDLHAASDSGNIWNAGDVRKLIQPLRALGCAVVLVHHVRKSDGASRDSGDLEAAPDMNIAFDPGYSFGGDAPPPGPRRLRYFGRWTEPTRALSFTEADGYALTNSTGGGGPEGGGDPFTVGEPADRLDGPLTGYLMAHPEGVSQKAVRKAVRGARVSSLVARLKVVGTLGPDKLWRRATDALSPPPKQAVPESQNPPVGNSGTGGAVPAVPVNGNKGGTGTGTGSGTGSHPIGEPPPGTGSGNRFPEPVPVALAGTKTPPPTPPQGDVNGTRFCGDNKAKVEPVAVNHEKSCPKCFGKGLDAFGKPCNYVRPVEPVVHTSGIKRWDDATATWVDATLRWDDRLKLWVDTFPPDGGKLGNVHLTGKDGWFVRDGDPGLHIPSRCDVTDGAEQEGMVH